jgi:hypothetical protein
VSRPFIVTGCGRSGTLYASQLFTAAGLRCRHEHACDVTGFRGFGDAAGEASWFAAAYLDSLPRDTVVLHQVRDPIAVATSWYRIGLFGPNALKTVCYGRVSPRRLVSLLKAPRTGARRWRYVLNQRRLVDDACGLFQIRDEAERCFRYWSDWNRLVERASAGRRLYRFRLEDLGPAVWQEIARFLDADLGQYPQVTRVNRKSRYPPRAFPDVPVPEHVRALAMEYGYDVSGRAAAESHLE